MGIRITGRMIWLLLACTTILQVQSAPLEDTTSQSTTDSFSPRTVQPLQRRDVPEDPEIPPTSTTELEETTTSITFTDDSYENDGTISTTESEEVPSVRRRRSYNDMRRQRDTYEDSDSSSEERRDGYRIGYYIKRSADKEHLKVKRQYDEQTEEDDSQDNNSGEDVQTEEDNDADDGNTDPSEDISDSERRRSTDDDDKNIKTKERKDDSDEKDKDEDVDEIVSKKLKRQSSPDDDDTNEDTDEDDSDDKRKNMRRRRDEEPTSTVATIDGNPVPLIVVAPPDVPVKEMPKELNKDLITLEHQIDEFEDKATEEESKNTAKDQATVIHTLSSDEYIVH